MPIGGATIDGVTAGGGGIKPFFDFTPELPLEYEGAEILYGKGAGLNPPPE